MNTRVFRRAFVAVWVLSLSMATVRGNPPWTYKGESAWNPPAGYVANGTTQQAANALPMDATVQENPPQITLTLYSGSSPSNSGYYSPNFSGTYDIFRKKAEALTWDAAPAGTVTVGTTNATWTDTTVVVGQIYEYGIAPTGTTTRRHGVLAAGIKGDQTLPKGRIAIVVASDVPTGLPAEYAQYKADLVADGWTVHEVPVARAKDYNSNGTGAADPYGVPGPPYPSDHVAVRNQLIALYNQYPGELKEVVLLGKVPVERSGHEIFGPDGHGNVAAMGADCYYADMDGVWTDLYSNAPFTKANSVVKDYTYSGGTWTAADYINNADGSVVLPSSMLPISSSAFYLNQIKTYRLQGGGPFTVYLYAANRPVSYIVTVQNGLMTNITNSSADASLLTGFTNVPGDNKFDAEYLDSITPNANLELGFGRIDFSNDEPAERESLRTYFNKLHRYKTASPDFRPARKAIHRTGFPMVSQCCLDAMPGVFGMKNIDWIQDTDLPTVPDLDNDAAYSAQTSSSYFYFKGGGGPSYSAGARAVFWTGMQSHWGYWYNHFYPVMARRLGEDNFALSYTWSIGLNGFDTSYLYHRLGMGFDAGDMMRVSMSSRGGTGAPAGFVPTYARASSQMFMQNMGDPTVRLFMFPPASGLSVVPAGGKPSLTWTASPEPGVVGYHVYRATTAAGPFTRLTSAPVTGTSYVDAATSSGAWTYMVRAVRLETTGGGTFYNASLGVQQGIDLSAGPAALQIATAALPDAPWNTAYQANLNASGGTPLYNWTVVAGALPPGLTLTADGGITGKTTAAGNSAFTVQAVDALGQTATKPLNLTALSTDTATLYAEAARFVSSNGTTVGDTFGDAEMRISGPSYYYQTFLRFDLSGVNVHNQFVRAKVVLTMDESTSITTNALVQAALTEDAGDGWTDTSLTYANRPLDQTTVMPTNAPVSTTPFGTMEIDVTRLVQATLANDPAKKLGVRLFTNSPGTDILISTRFAPRSGQPRLVIETTDAPALTILSPTMDPVSVPAGSPLQINATAVAVPARAGSLTVQWSKLSGPGTVTFNSPAQPSTGAVFSTPGDYVLRLSANDGALQSSRDLTVHVLAVPTGTVATNGALDGLILRLPFDESSGTTAADASGVTPSNPGTLTTIVTGGPLPAWNPTGGVAGGTLTFDGTNQRVEVNDSTANPLDGLPQLSISLWVKVAAAANSKSHAILVKRTSATASTTSYALTLNTNNQLVAAVANNATTATSTRVLTINTWYHVVMVFDGSQSAKNLRLYVNGSPETFATVAGLTTLPRISASKLRVGDYTATSPSTSVAGLNGSVDEVRLYNRALTQAEILDLAVAVPSNIGPSITTAATVSGTAGQPFTLNATVGDDGQPGALSLNWSRVSGPGTVTFGNSTANSTTATASAAGSQLLRITASDGAIVTFADVTATITGPAFNAYQQWAQSHGLPTDGSGNGALTAAPAGDGITNAMKYALGLDPNTPGYGGRYTTGKATSGGYDYLSVTYVRPEPAPDGVSYVVQTGSDPSAWSNTDAVEVSNTTANGLRTITVRDSKPIGQTEPRRFIRLNVQM